MAGWIFKTGHNAKRRPGSEVLGPARSTPGVHLKALRSRLGVPQGSSNTINGRSNRSTKSRKVKVTLAEHA